MTPRADALRFVPAMLIRLTPNAPVASMGYMMISKAQRNGLQIVVTADNVTAAQIGEARDRWPEWISSERSAMALGLPESSTPGGLPVYPPSVEIHHARGYIARVISAHWGDPSAEHSITNHPQDPAEVRLAHELAEGE